MGRALSSTQRRLAAKKARGSFRKGMAVEQTTRAAGRVGKDLLSINGQFVPGAIDEAMAEVVNVGRLAAAVYGPANGSTVVVSVGGGSIAGGGGGGLEPHPLNSGFHTGSLGDAQAPQFFLLSGTRPLTGDVNAGGFDITNVALVDGVDLAAHVADPDAHHLRASGGGGISVSGAQSVSVNLAGNSGLTITSSQLTMGAPSTISVGTSNAITGSTHTHAITANSNQKLNPNTVVRSTGGAVTFSQVSTDVLTADVNILVSPVGDKMVIMPTTSVGTDNYNSQLTGWRIDYNGAGDFRYLYTDELHAKAFIADLEQALAGGQIITKSVTMLAQPFTVPAPGNAANIFVKDLPSAENMQVFQAGDIIRLRQFDRSGGQLSITNAWGVVTAYVDGANPKEQRWTFTRSSAPNAGAMTTGAVLQPDLIILDYGTSGNGFIETNAIDGLNAVNSPYTQIVTWTGHPATGLQLQVRVGNLIGVNDPVLNPVGFGLYGRNVYLSGIVSAANDVVRLDSGGIRIKLPVETDFDDLYAYTFHDSVSQEIGGVYARAVNLGGGLFDGAILMQATGTATRTANAQVFARTEQSGAGISTVSVLLTAINPLGNVSIYMERTAISEKIEFEADLLHMLGELNTRHVVPIQVAGSGPLYDLGSAGKPYRTVFAQVISADTIVGGVALSGATWAFNGGDMTISSSSTGTRTLFIANPSSGVMGINVEGSIVGQGSFSVTGAAAVGAGLSVTGSITVTGTVDNVNLSDLDAAYNAHAASTVEHGAVGAVVGTTNTQTLSNKTLTTPVISNFASAQHTHAGASSGGQISHTVLTNVTADQHHPQVHVFANQTSLGPDHTISGGTVGHVFRVTGAATGRLAQLQHGDLGDVTADQHHVQIHNITGGDHTISGAAFSVVGAVSLNNLGLLVPSAAPTGESLLKSNSAGGLRLENLTVRGNIDVTTGGDITVGNNVFFVDASQGNVGINCAPDIQFDLDAFGNIRAQGWFVGKHAIQVEGAILIAHYDGPLPFTENTTLHTEGHMGQVASTNTTPVGREGAFRASKALEIAEATTNLIANPEFANASATGWVNIADGTATGTRTVFGASKLTRFSYRIVKTGGGTNDNFGTYHEFSVTSGQTYTVTAWVNVTAISGGAQSVRLSTAGALPIVVHDITGTTAGWVRLTATATATSTGLGRLRVFALNANTATFFVANVQAENLAYPTPYTVTSRLTQSVVYSASQMGERWLPWTGFSVGFWYNVDFAASIVGRNLRLFDLFVDANNRWVGHLSSSTNNVVVTNGTDSLVSSVAPTTQGWHYVVFTVANGAMTLYVDGQQSATGTATVEPFGTPAAWVGFAATGGSQPLNGLIDDFALINRAMPPSEILAIFESRAPIFAETSTFNWRLPNNLVWGDGEGLWVRTEDGVAAFGISGVNGKSWAGVTLDAGDLIIGNNATNYVLWDQSTGVVDVKGSLLIQGNSEFQGVVTIGASGEIRQGTGTLGSNFTGLRMWRDGSVGRIGGYNANVLQWYGATDGKFYAGDGNVILDSEGMAIKTTDVPQGKSEIKFINSAGDVGAYVGAYMPPTSNSIEIYTNSLAGRSSLISILSDAASGLPAIIQLITRVGGVGRASITMGGQFSDDIVHIGKSLFISQSSATLGQPTLSLSQVDLSEEFIAFAGTAGANNPISTAALGSYYGKARVSHNGSMKWIALYN